MCVSGQKIFEILRANVYILTFFYVVFLFVYIFFFGGGGMEVKRYSHLSNHCF